MGPHREWGALVPTIVEGSQLAVRCRHYGTARTFELLSVRRVLPATIVCSNEHGREVRVRRADGKLFGEDYRHAEAVTPEVLHLNLAASLSNWAQHRAAAYINALTTEQIAQVRKLVETMKRENDAATAAALS